MKDLRARVLPFTILARVFLKFSMFSKKTMLCEIIE